MAQAELLWVPTGRQFTFDDLVHWQGKRTGDAFEDIAARIDVIVLGPHASAAFPGELREFVSAELTCRKQHDFSDVITGDVGRTWADLDPRTVFIEAPHSRVALDGNRAPQEDIEPALREFFKRLQKQRAGEDVSFAGCDEVRPITFAGEDVLIEPTQDQEWRQLLEAIRAAARLGVECYRASVERVISAVRVKRRESRRGGRQPPMIVGLHDTCSWKMRKDGAIVVERPEPDRMPKLVNFGNGGDHRGDHVGLEGSEEPTPRLASGERIRQMAAAWCTAFGYACDASFAHPAANACDEIVSFNRPFKGGAEVKQWGLRVQYDPDFEMACDIFQVEFDRDALLGPDVAGQLKLPGSDWPAVDQAHVLKVASNLKAAHDALYSGIHP
jgi:hypothetical protein